MQEAVAQMCELQVHCTAFMLLGCMSSAACVALKAAAWLGCRQCANRVWVKVCLFTSQLILGRLQMVCTVANILRLGVEMSREVCKTAT